jgi:lipoprotein signal peptidase
LYNLTFVSAFFFILGTIITYFAGKGFKISPLGFGIAVVILFVLDQGIKLVAIQNSDLVFPIIDDWLVFRMFFHERHIFNATLRAGSGGLIPPLTFVFLPFIILFFHFLIYRSYTYYKKNKFHMSVAFVLIYTGCLVFYFDSIFRGGAYDWLSLTGFAIVDFRDICLTLAMFLICHSSVYGQSWRDIKKENTDDPFGILFVKHEYRSIKAWLKRERGSV